MEKFVSRDIATEFCLDEFCASEFQVGRG